MFIQWLKMKHDLITWYSKLPDKHKLTHIFWTAEGTHIQWVREAKWDPKQPYIEALLCRCGEIITPINLWTFKKSATISLNLLGERHKK